MDFFEQLKRTDLPRVSHPDLPKASSLSDRLLGGYVKLFNSRLKPMKPLALVNDMPVYDLTQPPLDSAAGARVLRTGFNYMVLRKPARPINMVLMLTPACDMTCAHCSARNYMKTGRKAMELPEIRDLLDQFVEMGGSSIIFSGGEPTLYPRLADLVARVDKTKAVVAIFSNGAKLAERADELQSAGLFGTLVSLDSCQEARHDELRSHPGAYKRAIHAVETLRDRGMLVGISTYVTHQGVQEGTFQQTVDLGTELGVQQVFVFDAVPTGALLRDSRWTLTPEDHHTLKEQTKAQNAKPEGPAVMGQSWINSSEGFGCFAGFYQLYVTAQGDVCPCDFTPISFGNVREERLEVIWERLRGSGDWGPRYNECRMQNACFRSSTVDLIPEGTELPVPYETIQALRRDHKKACNC